MENKTEEKTNFFLKHIKLSIILIYNFGNVIIAAIVYSLVPFLVGYPSEVMRVNSNKIGISIGMQYVFIDSVAVIFGTLVLLYLLKGIDGWQSAKISGDQERLKRIRTQCINTPYNIYLIQFGFLGLTTVLIGIVVSMADGFSLFPFIKIVSVVFAFCALASVFSHIFTKRILTGILKRTYNGDVLSGRRVGIKNKIFLQILPMFIVGMLFLALFSYTSHAVEIGNITCDSLRTQLNDLLSKNAKFQSTSELFNSLKQIKAKEVTTGYYAVNKSTGKITVSDNFTPDVFFEYFAQKPIQGYRVYGLTNEIQGVEAEATINGNDYYVGIRVDNYSNKNIQIFLIVFFILLGLNILILYYFSKSLTDEVDLISKSLTEISEDERLERNKKLSIISNDELADMGIAFNKIRERELEYDKLKNEFIANISHELRTPISIIFSSVQLMELYEKEPSEINVENSKKRLSSIKQNSLRLIRLINNIIDITRVDSGFIEMNLQKMDIISFVHRIVISVREHAKNKGIHLSFHSDTDIKQIVFDPDKIEAIILNLLSNAIKFSYEGGKISLNMTDMGESVVISVKDTGIGIPEDMKEIIFERFRRVDQSIVRSFEGSGIGLSLTKSYVELHKGKISVESEENKGSEFIVELPADLEPVENKIKSKNNYNASSNNGISRINIEFSDIYELHKNKNDK